MSMESSLCQSWTVQKRVIYALLMREIITRFGRENLGVLWLVAEPMIFTLGIAALWTAAGMAHGSSMPIIAFAITGYSSILLWRNCASRTAMAIEHNKLLLFHRNVRVVDLFIARSVIEIIGATASFVTLGTFFIMLGKMPLPVDPLKVLLGWGMLAWFGVCMALLIGAATGFSHIVEKLWHPTSYLLFPLSGAAFMVDWLTPEFQSVVLLLPMVHGVELLRDGYFGNAVRTHYDLGYMAVSCLVLTFVGLALSREAGRRVEG
jgi:capsular polysaccharide transport system permease protein